MREHPKVDAHLASASPTERVMICSVLFAMLPCQPVPEAAGDHYATVKLTRERRGLALDENDLWIAATALALGAVLISRDSDFQQIDGLTVEDWTV